MSSHPPDRFLPTRQSLLSRLRSWDDHDSWRDFFETYWRLIYDVARKSGLEDAEAQDVVQETIVAVARQMPDFRYDPSKGRFKNWLHQITRRRITDHLRKHYRTTDRETRLEPNHPEPDSPSPIEELPDPATVDLDTLWEREWKAHLTSLALERVKRRAKPEHFQVFDLLVVQGWSATQVAKALGVSLPLVYVVRHRIGAQVKTEIQRLQATDP